MNQFNGHKTIEMLPDNNLVSEINNFMPSVIASRFNKKNSEFTTKFNKKQSAIHTKTDDNYAIDKIHQINPEDIKADIDIKKQTMETKKK